MSDASIFPGMHRLTAVGGTVRDFGVLRPVLVYNCAYMPSICNNIKKYLGSLPTTPVTFHADFDLRAPKFRPAKSRKDTRREAVCPSNWITTNKKANGDWRCPESDQPKWTGYTNWESGGVKKGPFDALLSQKEKDGAGNPVTNPNRLATKGD